MFYYFKRLIFLLFILGCSNISLAQKRYISSLTKQIVFTRDRGICQCCGSQIFLEYDHITPFSCGGSNQASNIQLLCRRCNRSKSNSCICKIHNKTVGTNCCDSHTPSYKKDSEYIEITPKSISFQCIGNTKKGRRCRNRTTNTNHRCHLH